MWAVSHGIGHGWIYSRVRTQIGKIAGALRRGRHGLIEIAGHPLLAPLLRPEEERLRFVFVVDARNVYGATDCVAVVVLLVWRDARIEIILGVKHVVAHELVHIAVELVRSGLGLDF